MTLTRGIGLLALIFLTGCDLVGTYEARRKQRGQTITTDAQRAELLGSAITIPDKAGQSTSISLTLPRAVGASMKGAAGPGVVDGIAGMFEADGSNGAGPLVFVGGVPAAQGPVEKVVGVVTAVIQGVAPGVNPQVSDAGPNIKRITAVGAQSFSIGGAPQSVPGRTDAVVITSGTHIAILVFRATDANAKALEDGVNASLSTVAGAAPLAAPMPAGS